MVRISNPIIGFTEENTRCLHHPHDDALVSNRELQHTPSPCGRSFADILYYPTSQQMRIGKEWLIPTNAPLIGFGETKVHPLGAVTLPVTVKDYPQQITKDVTFLVADCSSAYNAILGRPTLNSWKAVTLTYHLLIKVPIEYEVGEVRRDQVAAHESYIAMLDMDDHLLTMCIEE